MINVLANGFPYKPNKGCFGYSTCILVNKSILFDTGGYNLRKVIVENITSIDKVVISHLHFDHCSNLDLFINKKTPIYISKKELEYYYQNKEIDTDLFSYFEYLKEKLNIVEIEDTYQLEDNIKIISTPGHTPGHISLEVKEKQDNILLAGDCLKTYNDYKNINEYGNAIDQNQYIETKKRIIKDYNIIYPGHDVAIKNGLKIEMEKLVDF